MSETNERQRKKRKKKKASARREGVPAFAARFPRDKDLDALLVAFDQGNYARVREDAARLAKNTEDDAVRRAAEELLRRIEPDPLAKYMLLAACALLAFFTLWYYTHRLAP